MLFLIHYDKDGKKESWALDKERISLGRSSRANIVIKDQQASRIHGYIILDNQNYVYIDANSSNGSFINEVRVHRQLLKPGDIIRIGDMEFLVAEADEGRDFMWDDSMVIVKSQFSSHSLPRRLEEFTEAPTEIATHGARAILEKTSPLQVEKYFKRLKTLYQLFERISSVLRCQQLYEIIVNGVFELLPSAQTVALVIGDEKKGNYYPVIIRSKKSEISGALRVSKTALQLAIKSRVTLLATEVAEDPQLQKANSALELKIQSLLCAPLVIKEELIGSIYVDNREGEKSFNEIDAEFLTTLANHSAIAIENARLYDTLQRAHHQTILALQNVIETRDPLTMGHVYRTAQFAAGIARELGLSEEVCQNIKTAAELHDIGKISLGQSIVSKPGELSFQEYFSMQEHVELSEQILAPIEHLHAILPIIRQHHERFDGKGYPDGLQGEEILIEARILAVADAFDALSSQRSYKKALSIDEAFAHCQQEAGKQFDPKVVKALEKYLQKEREFVESLIGNPPETV